jgi:hypothetical protein
MSVLSVVNPADERVTSLAEDFDQVLRPGGPPKPSRPRTCETLDLRFAKSRKEALGTDHN